MYPIRACYRVVVLLAGLALAPGSLAAVTAEAVESLPAPEPVTPAAPSTGDDRQAAVDTEPVASADPAINDLAVLEGALDEPLAAVDPQQVIDEHLAMLVRLEAEGDSYNSNLAETAYGLGHALQEAGHHEAAIPVFRRALQITRINDGIYSLSQLPMLRAMIESQRASNQLEEAADQYQHLLWISTRYFGESDPRLIPLLEEISQWHLRVYSREPDRSKLRYLVDSHSLASSAVNLAVATGGQFSLGLIPLLKDIVRSSFYLAQYQQDYPEIQPQESTFSFHQSPMTSDPFPTQERNLLVRSYTNGRTAYEKIIEILDKNTDASNRERAAAYAELGDWYLIFGRRSSARAAYLEANSVLAREPDYPNLLKDLFGQPKMLPLILDDPESAPDSDELDSYVDVQADITPFGTARNVQVLKTFPEDSEKLASTAQRVLRDARFRPILIDGEPATATGTRFKLRLAEQ